MAIAEHFKKIVGLFLGITLLLFVFRSSFLVRVSSYVAYPVLQGYRIAIAPLKKWAARRDTVAQLYNKIKNLEQEQSDLKAQNIYLRASMAYVQGVHELRTFNKRYKKEGTMAHVLARDFSATSHYFYIDVGAQDTIKKDMVVTYKNNLIGKIEEVYPWYSKVCLVTDRRCKVAAYCSTSKTAGIYEGLNWYGAGSLCHVSHLQPIEKGELVLSSGEGLLFPEGLALGCITNCRTEGLYKHVTVKPLCDLQDIEYCSVVARG